jgi:hypothetical protein
MTWSDDRILFRILFLRMRRLRICFRSRRCAVRDGGRWGLEDNGWAYALAFHG